LRNLRSLRLSNNRLTTLDAGVFPSLHLLYLDQNGLSTVDGLHQCRHLGVLSVREQTPPSPEPASALDLDLVALKGIRKLLLSATRLSLRLLPPSAPVLTLQLLDVASCGLPRLPRPSGALFPNL